MPTISDIISIKLNIDSSGFLQGVPEAVQAIERAKRSLKQEGDDLERIAKNVGYGLEKVIAGVAGFFGLVLSFEGFKNLVTDAAQAGTAMGRFAESIGKTVEMTQAYRQAFAAFSGGETGILGAIRRMKLDMAAVPLTATPWMIAVGTLTGKDVRGKEPEQILQDIADAAARRRMDAAHVIMWLRGSLPLTESDILLLSKPGRLESALEEQRKVGTPTTPQTQAAERLQADITNLKTTNKLLELQALTLMEPFLHELLTMAIRLEHWMRGIAHMLGVGPAAPPSAAAITGGVSDGTTGFGPVTRYMPPGSQTSLLATGIGRRTGFNPNTGRFETTTVPAGSGGRPLSFPTQEGDITGTGRNSGGRFNVPAGTSSIGSSERETITLANGQRVTVNKRAAAQFKGFFDDLVAAGAPVRNLGGVGVRPGNASQHPVGLAIDWAQSHRNVTDPDIAAWMANNRDKLNAIEQKWGISGGEHWIDPDTGHFSIETLFGSKHLTDVTGADKTDMAGSVEDRRMVRGSVFGPAAGWSPDPTQGGLKGPTGLSIAQPGIALPSRSGLGQMFEVTTPDGRKFILPQVDIGPFAKGRGIDITAEAAKRMGYTEKDFPTDALFGVRRLGAAAAAAQSFDANRPKIENHETSTHVNQVIVNTHATDATGIAQDVKNAIGKQMETHAGGGTPSAPEHPVMN